MRILFVCSGNRGGINTIIKRQAESLIKLGCKIDFYPIKGKGIFGYLKNILPLKRQIKSGGYDLVHSHYFLSAITASLAGAKRMIVSLMGSDVKSNKKLIFLIRTTSFLFSWHSIIVKSSEMKVDLGLKDVWVIPNGVDISLFKPLDRQQCCEILRWDSNHKNILFAGDPERKEKNFALTKAAYDQFCNSDYVLHILKDIPHETLPIWYNAADVVVLTSLWEGSPNVIKESMACNRPIVSTNVGDVAWLFENTTGCYLLSANSEGQVHQLMHLIEKAINIKNSDCRSKITTLGLDSLNIARKIIEIYSSSQRIPKVDN